MHIPLAWSKFCLQHQTGKPSFSPLYILKYSKHAAPGISGLFLMPSMHFGALPCLGLACFPGTQGLWDHAACQALESLDKSYPNSTVVPQIPCIWEFCETTQTGNDQAFPWHQKACTGGTAPERHWGRHRPHPRHAARQGRHVQKGEVIGNHVICGMYLGHVFPISISISLVNSICYLCTLDSVITCLLSPTVTPLPYPGPDLINQTLWLSWGRVSGGNSVMKTA